MPPDAGRRSGSRHRGPQTSGVIVFAGHRIDPPGRSRVRFPPERVAVVRSAMRAWLLEAKRRSAEPLEGIAGGAAGGDILFHEVCAEPDVSIPTRLLLALPAAAYVADSVQYAGPAWITRFWDIHRRLPTAVLGEEDEPRGVTTAAPPSVWSRNNQWLLRTALARRAAQITLLLLWDGQAGDGPGGTAEMIALARRCSHRRLRIVRLDPLARQTP